MGELKIEICDKCKGHGVVTIESINSNIVECYKCKGSGRLVITTNAIPFTRVKK